MSLLNNWLARGANWRALALHDCNLHLTMSSGSLVGPITTNLPSTLVKWRDYDTSPMIALWDHLRTWPSLQGLHIFEVILVKPPANELRDHDGTYSTHYGRALC